MAKYDKGLIEKLCKEQPKGAFNCTSVAKKYAEIKKLEYSVKIARRIQIIVKAENFNRDFTTPAQSEYFKDALQREIPKGKCKVFMITWAQSHTPISKNLLTGMKVYAEKINGRIVVIPGTYVNYNSSFKKIPEVWDPAIQEYLIASEKSIHPYLKVISDADIIPTASRPLTGLEGMTTSESSIIGHPRQHTRVTASMKNSRRKYIASTGALTLPNYRRSRVGKKARLNHKLGFIVVEIFDNEHFTFRHVEAKEDGSFQDLIYRVDKGIVTENGTWDAMIFGDTHLSKEDPEFLKESRRLFEKADTEMSVWHDLFDGYSINHHEAKDYVSQVIKEKKNLNCLQSELEKSFDFIEDWKDTNMKIIPSNHPDWIDKWVRLNQGTSDKKNAFLFNSFQNILFNELAPKGLYAYLIDTKFENDVHTLHRDDSLVVNGFELNNHGDLGANGAKASPLTFSNLQIKIVSADKHTMYTVDNAHGVGVSTHLDHGYNKGLSSWNQSNGIILKNGTFQHLIFEGGKFTNLM